MLPTPRSSTSPPPEDCRGWPGRGRPPWRPGCTPPHQQQKRRAACMASQDGIEGHPPKRQRTRGTSFSQRSTDAFPDPTNWQFREPTPSNSRRSSPVRGVLEELRNSKPKVTIDAQMPLPERIWNIRQKFGAVVRKAYIPAGLRGQLQRVNPQKSKDIIEEAYDLDDCKERDQDDGLWRETKGVHDRALQCEEHQKDENAWSDDVVRPILLWGDDLEEPFFQLVNVKTQAIYTDYLARDRKGGTFQKKTDYALAFSDNHKSIKPFYRQVSYGGCTVALSQMNDVYTRMLAMMVGIEVKPAYGGSDVEAQSQLVVWIAAAFKSRRTLIMQAVGDATRMDHVPIFGWTVVGHRWELYFGFIDNGETGDVFLQGPDPIISLNTRVLEDVFKLRALLTEIKRYGREEYWESLKECVVQPMSEARPAMADPTPIDPEDGALSITHAANVAIDGDGL